MFLVFSVFKMLFLEMFFIVSVVKYVVIMLSNVVYRKVLIIGRLNGRFRGKCIEEILDFEFVKVLC